MYSFHNSEETRTYMLVMINAFGSTLVQQNHAQGDST
jgi:hypothetical protein